MSDGHSSLDELADLDEGLLDPARADDVRAHLAGCESCRAEHQALLDVHQALQDLPAETMPADVAERIDAALADADVPRSATVVPLVTPPSRQRRSPALAGVAAVVVLLAFIGAVVVGHHRHDSQSGDEASSAGAGALAPTTLPPAHIAVKFSNRTYDQQTVTGAVKQLLSGGAHSTVVPNNVNGAEQSTNPAPSADASATRMAPQALPRALHPLYLDPKRLVACGAQVGPVQGAVPEAVLFARYSTPTLKAAPSAIYVFATTADRADIVVVGPSCSGVQQVRDYLSQRPVG